MAISNELSTQFAKVINTKQKDEGQTVRGTYKEINGIKYVQLDGSDILTPVKTTVDAETGDKVSVLIKDHDATIMGNISSPAARATVVENLSDTVDEQGNTIEQLDNTIIQQGNSIVQMNTTINQHTTTISQHDTTIRQQGDRITSIGNTVTAQGNTIDSLNNTVTQHGDTITSIGNTVTAQGNTLVQHDNRITQNENDITQQGNTISEYGDQITSIGNTVTDQGNSITSLNNSVTSIGNTVNQQGDRISSLDNTVTAQGNTISAHGTAINTANSQITILNSGFTIENGQLTGLSSIIVNDLTTNKLTTSYAKIDFSNIGIAAIQKVFADSGIIRDLVVQQGHITGELVGVTINGDLINANTLKADKLVVKGSDGIYYKLNIDGMDHISVSEAAKFILTTSEPANWSDNYKDYYIISNNEYVHVSGNTAPTWAANTYYKLKSTYESGLDGSTIVAHTITADKVSVNDLVAFGATIGGFDIGQHSIHSVGKTSVQSLNPGLYMDDSGQLSLGDDTNYIVYEIDSQTGETSLQISADDIYLGSKQRFITDELDEIRDEVTYSVTLSSETFTIGGGVNGATSGACKTTIIAMRGNDIIAPSSIGQITFANESGVASDVLTASINSSISTALEIIFSIAQGKTLSETIIATIPVRLQNNTITINKKFSFSVAKTGQQGTQGPQGNPGSSYYTWIKYADDASGSNMTDNPTGKEYMGIAYNKTSSTKSNNPNDYTWSKIKGEDGSSGDVIYEGTTPPEDTNLFWYNTVDNTFYKYDGTTWIKTTSTIHSGGYPTNYHVGDYWIIPLNCYTNTYTFTTEPIDPEDPMTEPEFNVGDTINLNGYTVKILSVDSDHHVLTYEADVPENSNYDINNSIGVPGMLLTITSSTQNPIPNGCYGGTICKAINSRATYLSSDWINTNSFLPEDMNEKEYYTADVVEGLIEDARQSAVESAEALNNTTNDSVENVKGIVNGLQGDISGLQSDMAKAITTEYFDSEIQKLRDQIRMQVVKSGGNNLLKNSVGFKEKSFWVLDTTAHTTQQTFITLVNEKISISFKYKKPNTNSAIIKIVDSSNEISLLNTSENISEWTEVVIDYNSISTSPYIYFNSDITETVQDNDAEIHGVSGSKLIFNNGLQVTDLMINYGESQTWSQYFDEVYGKTHRLDVTGLDIIDAASNAKSHTDANSIDFYNAQGTLESQFSKSLSITDNLIVHETIKMGNYTTWRLDDNNILEY